MKTTQTYAALQLKTVLCFIVLLGISLTALAQGITVYQNRQVPDDQIDAFIERETTYWSKVAEKGFEKGNLTFWALLQKVGGYDMPNSSNFLFINTYNDIDNLGGIWDAAKVFPDVSMEKMETNSISKTTSMLFMKSQGWQNAENAAPDTDYKYLRMIYHQASDPGALIQAEIDIWGPFIKSAMDKNLTSQKAWGNSLLLAPTGPEIIHFNTISFDLYPSLKESLDPRWDDSLEVPENMSQIVDLENGPRMSVIYKIVKAVSAEDQ